MPGLGPEKTRPGSIGGLTGALGGVRNIAQLTELLRPHFAPASLVQPPLATTQTGGRAVVNVTQNAVLSMRAGTVAWTFPVPYLAAVPVVTNSVFGVPVGTATIYIAQISKTGVTFKSTNPGDTRELHITATGQPN